VTGGSRGIGAETCRALADCGARVVVAGRDKTAIDAVVTGIRAGGAAAIGAVADCTCTGDVERMRATAEEAFGPVDVVCAFAGGGGDPVPLSQMSVAVWFETVESNLTSAFLTVRAFLPGMMERRSGSIITMASSAGRLAGGASAPYAAAKAGVIMLTRQLAAEAGEYGVRANCVAPSLILTESQEQRIPAERRGMIAQHFPLRRLGTPADVAAAALFLASDSAGWLTGVTLDVAGGRIMV
jgi:3-oxoacyl-[acyl-carrier protein] reductase